MLQKIVFKFHDLFDDIFSFFSTLSEGTRRRLLETHGYLKGLALFIFLGPAYQQLDRMEDHVLWADEKVIEGCRQTYMQECNMSAIAVSHLLWGLLRIRAYKAIYLTGHDHCSSRSNITRTSESQFSPLDRAVDLSSKPCLWMSGCLLRIASAENLGQFQNI